jgi:hypothetical protein
LKFNYYFIPAGSVVHEIAGKLVLPKPEGDHARSFYVGEGFVLDVGNSIGNGIVDHHQPGTENECVASLIAGDPGRYVGDFLVAKDSYTLVTHSSPDLDALSSLYLTRRYITDGVLPAFISPFAEYILSVDSGRKKLDINSLIEPYSLVLAISYCVTRDPSIDNKDYVVLERTFRLFDILWDVLKQGVCISKFDWSALNEFDYEIAIIKNDYAKYENDVVNVSNWEAIQLKNKYTKKLEMVDCLISKHPQSVLWKYWARSDMINSPQKKGFQATVAFLPSEKLRAIIAVDPNSSFTLKGLGVYLDCLEMLELLKMVKLGDIIGNKRAGFHRNNPWYDGRSSMHDFSIIDAPRGGSLLSEECLIRTMKQNKDWVNLDADFLELEASDLLTLFVEDIAK